VSSGRVVIGDATGALRNGFGPVHLDVQRLVESRLLVQANSGGGKSWALRRILEQTHGRLQHLVIDPEGEFATLRARFDYVLAAKSGGDTLADPRAARLLAERLLELNVSAILDIYELKPHERIRFVRGFLEALVDAPKSLWHDALVVVDEAHVYCPEQGDAESAGAVIDLATRGRKRGFCAVLATQRLSKLKKDAAAELNNKLIGRAALDLDIKRAADELGFTKDRWQDIRQLPAGEFFAFGPAISDAVLQVHVGPVQTKHPKSGGRQAASPPSPSATVRALLPKLADLPAEAENRQRTEAELRAEVAALKRQLAQQPKPVAPTEPKPQREVLVLKPSDLERLEGSAKRLQEVWAIVEAKLARLSTGLGAPPALVAQATHALAASGAIRKPEPRRLELRSNEALVMPPGERAVLVAAAQRPEGVGRDQLSVLTGYKRSSRDAYVSRLAAAGLVEVRGALIVATAHGVAALGPNFDPLPTGEALRDYWLARLPHGEAAVFRCVLAEHPDPVPRARIDEVTGYKRSSRDAYISRLVARRVVETQGRAVSAARELFA